MLKRITRVPLIEFKFEQSKQLAARQVYHNREDLAIEHDHLKKSILMEVEICVIEQFDRKEVLVLHVDKCHDISKDLHQVHEVFHVSLFEIPTASRVLLLLLLLLLLLPLLLPLLL